MDQRAVVIGAGMAGLAAARVLSERFAHVVVLDRDVLPGEPVPRRGVPQGSQPHIMLAGGMRTFNELFPGFETELIAAGGTRFDTGLGLCSYRMGRRWPSAPTGVSLVAATRPLIEAIVRARVTTLPNVTLRDRVAVSGLLGSAREVTGVVLDDGETLDAGLVVDCTGRGARSDRWLAALGLPIPAQLEVKVGVAYTSRLYRRQPGDLTDWSAIFILPTPPGESLSGLALPVEGDRWLTAIGGWHVTEPPADAETFEGHARGLPDPILSDLLDRAEPISDLVTTRFPASRRRLFEDLRDPPPGYVALGDAICSFNPIYGQGMSCAAMSAIALGHALDKHGRQAARAFYAAAAAILDVPWSFAVGGDFSFPRTVGPRPRGFAVRRWYSRRIALASQIDSGVNGTFARVQHLIDPPRTLMRPGFVLRVLRMARKRRRGSGPVR
ncbi:FAD-binding monooxygenase [Paractinoplanes abujensis]|uniref:2-polyprenyl-6-methoxyphenol hydroxylase-like FAD-dependent oxidoreductase n=1 Tax=Paractinoplanes abujensis TaxID=882441 RepID=A0A7W7CX06_9ACTN|nr:NAD(P)-binding protein [Actinoplanes abujensis]MBB4695000.1 2-polyprenyl-6-methoxyphenol hydroxylase-like FAD-dependent oxidoreductase [Actinoplanes abujensis]GID23732.1 FAD-binding monooxygenase [Actinoplanes abujensis]